MYRPSVGFRGTICCNEVLTTLYSEEEGAEPDEGDWEELQAGY